MADINALNVRIEQHNATYRVLAARKDALLARILGGDEGALDDLRAMDGEVASLIATELQLQEECQAAMAELDAVYSKLGEAEAAEGWRDEALEAIESLQPEEDDDWDDEKGLAATIAALEHA